MKSIKLYLFLALLFIFPVTKVFTQNIHKQEPREKDNSSKIDSILVHGYFTEKDYNELYGIKLLKENKKSIVCYNDEIYSKKNNSEKDKDTIIRDTNAEIIVELVINTLFIIAAFWH